MCLINHLGQYKLQMETGNLNKTRVQVLSLNHNVNTLLIDKTNS